MIEEYKRSLKLPEAEEIFDLYVYRPVAFVFVKSIYRLPITPNQVTFLALLAGLVAAWNFAAGTLTGMLWGALWYGVSNVLDCSDGQLARLQQSGTPLGRLVDGVVDYIISIAIFVGIGIGFAASSAAGWSIVVMAGISSAMHAIAFDHYQSDFISVVQRERHFHEGELRAMTETLRRLETGTTRGPKAVILRLYVQYLRAQSNLLAIHPVVDPEHFRTDNLGMIRMWSFLGPTTNRTALIICAAAGRIDIYLWGVILLGNFWLMVCSFRQRSINRGLHRRIE
jgi:phosphatidylglycerophosphate synthase